ncbi:MAG: type 4a pilus biogenesis protein PilO [Panacagrimonas sp.]
MNFSQAIEDLRNVDPQSPGTWPGWVRIAAALVTAGLIVGAGAWFLIKPKKEELANLETEETRLFAEFEKKHKKVVALDAYKAQLHQMEREFGDMLRQLPSKAEVANLLNDISQTRVASSLEEELFKPEAEVLKEFYAELPNRIIVTGDYHEMGSFVGAVAALPRIVTIDEVEIKPAKTGRGSRDQIELPEGTLRMTALARTYRYLDDEELEAIADEVEGAGG